MDASAAELAPLLKKAGLDIESEVRGSSMHPTLPPGARIRIRCGPVAHQRGDIVAIVADPPIVHRIVSCLRCRSRLYLITRGDASWSCDLPVTEDEILGVVSGYQDGDAWRQPRAFEPQIGIAAVLPWLSHTSIRMALRISEDLASLVARGGAVIASWHAGRA